jgi:signal transduction histidine kinase
MSFVIEHHPASFGGRNTERSERPRRSRTHKQGAEERAKVAIDGGDCGGTKTGKEQASEMLLSLLSQLKNLATEELEKELHLSVSMFDLIEILEAAFKGTYSKADEDIIGKLVEQAKEILKFLVDKLPNDPIQIDTTVDDKPMTQTIDPKELRSMLDSVFPKIQLKSPKDAVAESAI